MSKIEVDEIVPRSGNNLTVGSSGQTIIVPAGATFNASNSTFTLPDGTVTAAKIASSLDLSGKTVTLPASAVTAHVTPFDDNKIVNDISTLALRQASDGNRGAYSTNSQSVDVFQDATGIDTTTNTLRDANEYISTVGVGTETLYQTSSLDINYITAINMNYQSDKIIDGSVSNDWAMYVTGPSNYTNGFEYDITSDPNFGSNFTVTKVSWHNFNTAARFRYYRVPLFSNGSYSYANITPEDSSSQSDSITLEANNTNNWNTAVFTTPIKGAKFKILFDSFYNNGNTNAGLSEIRFSGIPQALNPTGNFTGTTITAPSSVSEMGAIITYQDFSGTNALNTDIVLQLSADGGSNYSTATLTALPDFATGIKMAKVNDLAVTAGTQLKYKISFANQANGSKEARIRGVALQY